MRDINDKVDNDGATPDGQYPSNEFNSLKNEARNAVLRSGQSLDPNSTLQLAESLFLHGTKATVFQASGSENAVVITPLSGSGGVKIPADYSNMGGVRAVFTATVANTGATTVNIGQTVGTLLGVKDLRAPDGTALAGGEIGPNLRTEIEFDAVNDYWKIMPWSIPAAQISLPLSISNGGTGATDAAGARTNLQVPPNSRQITASGLATGGGTLESDRDINVPASSQAQAEAGTNNTTAMTPLRVAQAIAALGGEGGVVGTQIITTDQTYTPPANVSKVMIIATGGGGASGGVAITGGSDVQATGGGGAGATAILFYEFTGGVTGLDIVIGQGGVGGSGTGPDGGNTTVTEVGGGASLLIDVEGGRGSAFTATAPASITNHQPGTDRGEVATLAAGGLALPGGDGQDSTFCPNSGIGGMGGASYWGGGGRGERVPQGATGPSPILATTLPYGAGGGGAAQAVLGTSTRNGRSGADGVVFIIEYE